MLRYTELSPGRDWIDRYGGDPADPSAAALAAYSPGACRAGVLSDTLVIRTPAWRRPRATAARASSPPAWASWTSQVLNCVVRAPAASRGVTRYRQLAAAEVAGDGVSVSTAVDAA